MGMFESATWFLDDVAPPQVPVYLHHRVRIFRLTVSAVLPTMRGFSGVVRQRFSGRLFTNLQLFFRAGVS